MKVCAKTPVCRGQTIALPWIVLLLAILVVARLPAQDPDRDRDKDGLSDVQEVHKYGTDPQRADSDGDGVPDGEWRERREYQYTVRSVVQVLRPVTPEFLGDDYQDARVLDETRDWVELEVIHYPFSTVADAIAGDAGWRRAAARMQRWTEPGPTNDWTPKMRTVLLAALQQAGIDAAKLDDRALVERASHWLCEHANSEDGFTVFMTGFDDRGRPFVPDHFAAAVERSARERGRSVAEQWSREISARGMFEHGKRGTCTSSAIYLNGCLRALGVPTRTVLCIPIIDAGDERERALVQRLVHHDVRRMVVAATDELRNSWASHTFNEVFVGGRWVRLNYDRLGQGILDRQLYGMITHVATFSDWAEARAWETIGRRQKGGAQDDVFGGQNPYSTISLRDEFGAHCKLENPAIVPKARITGLTWSDDPQLPDDVRAWFAKRGEQGLIAHVEGPRGQELADFLRQVDRRIELVAEGRPRLVVEVAQGCWWQGGALVAVLFDGAARGALAAKARYSVSMPNAQAAARWEYVGPAELAPRDG